MCHKNTLAYNLLVLYCARRGPLVNKYLESEETMKRSLPLLILTTSFPLLFMAIISVFKLDPLKIIPAGCIFGLSYFWLIFSSALLPVFLSVEFIYILFFLKAPNGSKNKIFIFVVIFIGFVTNISFLIVGSQYSDQFVRENRTLNLIIFSVTLLVFIILGVAKSFGYKSKYFF